LKNHLKTYKQIYYGIGILILLAALGYFIADVSWDNMMNTLTATEVPTPAPTLTPISALDEALRTGDSISGVDLVSTEAGILIGKNVVFQGKAQSRNAININCIHIYAILPFTI